MALGLSDCTATIGWNSMTNTRSRLTSFRFVPSKIENMTARTFNSLPLLIIITGTPGTGKTTLASLILKRTNAAYLDNNFIPDAFFPNTRRGPEYEEHRPRFYRALWRIVEENLLVGQSVLLVAPFVNEMQTDQWREHIIAILERANARVKIIHLTCSEKALRSRLEERGEARDQWKLDNWETFLEEQPINVQVPFQHLILDTESDPSDNCESAVRYILDRPEMPNNNSNNRYDALKSFWQDSLNWFDRRRVYEWRMCLAVWTAFAAFIVAVLADRVEVDTWNLAGAAILGALFCGVHLYFIANLHIRNNDDRLNADEFRRQMCELLGIELPSSVAKRFESQQQKMRSRELSWSHKSQIAFTILLYLALVGLVVHDFLVGTECLT